MTSFGSKLKELRTLRNCTQKDLAIYLKISSSLISMYEKNQRKPSYEVLEGIADFFNVDMNTLVGKGKETYYTDPEVAQLAEELKTNPEMRMLFDATKDISKEAMQQTYDYVKFLKAKEKGEV